MTKVQVTNRPSRIYRLLLIFTLCLLGSKCSVPENCDQVRRLVVSTVPWNTLIARCEKCLSPDELSRLKEEKTRFDELGISELFGHDKSVQDVLRDAEMLRSLDRTGSPQTDQAVSSVAPAPQPSSGPWVIPQSVLFVYADLPNDGGDVHHLPDATAFIVSVPHRKTSDHKFDSSFVRFLVTARHVVDPEWAHCSDQNRSEITARLNKKAGGVAFVRVPLRAKTRALFFTPEDDASDVAAIFLDRRTVPDLDSYKFIDVPFRLFPTSAEVGMFRADQPIMTAGLLPQFPGESENLPIFRTGVLSNMPVDAVKVPCDKVDQPKALKVWLISAAIPRGVSGAPVFTTLARTPGAARAPVLLGIQSMSWPDQQVAGITPANILGDLLQKTLTKYKFDVDFYQGAESR